MAGSGDGIVFETVIEILETDGIRAALRFLNARAPHRFTGIYRPEPPVLRSLMLFDRENPTLQAGLDAPLRETYCSIVAETGAPFATADPAHDPRVSDHPAGAAVLSYSGVPLRDESGTTIGTLCHFDVVPRPIPDEELSLMERLTPLIVAALRREGMIGSP